MPESDSMMRNDREHAHSKTDSSGTPESNDAPMAEAVRGGKHPGRGNMVPSGLEPRTLRLLAVRSNQLSYETLDAEGAG